MSQKKFSLIAGVIFLIVAVVHALRAILGWQAIIGGWTIPMWLSWPAVVIAGYLAYKGLKHSKQP